MSSLLSTTSRLTVHYGAKNVTLLFFNNSVDSITTDFNGFWNTEACGNLRSVDYKIVHITLKLSLHYLVKCTKLIVLTVRITENEQNHHFIQKIISEGGLHCEHSIPYPETHEAIFLHQIR